MKALYRKAFLKDLRALRDQSLRERVWAVIEAVKAASHTSDIGALRPIQGRDTAYRVRVGDFRIGLYIEDGVATFVRCLHRRDIYRYFP